MIEGSEKRNHQLAFELQNSHVCEKRSKRVDRFCANFEVQGPSGGLVQCILKQSNFY